MIDKIQILDNNIIELAKTLHTEQNTKIAKFLTEFGGKKGVIIFVIISIAIILLYYFKQSKKEKLHKEEDVTMFKTRMKGYIVAASVPVSIGISVIVKTIIKTLVSRPRPNAFPEIMIETGKSFPSGHSIGIATMATILIYFVIISEINRVLKYILVTFLVLLSLLIASTRLYMGVHYLSDVVVGLILGYIIGIVCMFGVEKSKKIIDEKY